MKIKTFQDFQQHVLQGADEEHFCTKFVYDSTNYEFIIEVAEEFTLDSCTKYFSYRDTENSVEFYFACMVYFACMGSGTSTVYWEYGTAFEVFPQEVVTTQYTTIKPE